MLVAKELAVGRSHREIVGRKNKNVVLIKDRHRGQVVKSVECLKVNTHCGDFLIVDDFQVESGEESFGFERKIIITIPLHNSIEGVNVGRAGLHEVGALTVGNCEGIERWDTQDFRRVVGDLVGFKIFDLLVVAKDVVKLSAILNHLRLRAL